LIVELGAGRVTASTLQMGIGLAALFAALGATILLTGSGLIWATRGAGQGHGASTRHGPCLTRAPASAMTRHCSERRETRTVSRRSAWCGS